MRLHFVSAYFHPVIGGVESYVWNLARQLEALGHEVTVHTSNVTLEGVRLPRREEIDGIDVRRYPLYPGWFLFPTIPPGSIVHFNAMGLNPGVYESLRSKPNRSVFTPHGVFMTHALGWMNGRLQGLLVRRYGMVIAQTEVERDHLIHELGVDPRRVQLVRTGVDDSSFESGSSEGHPGTNSILERGSRYILSVGNVLERKRFWIGVRTLAELGKEIHFVVAGAEREPSAVERIEQDAKKLDVAERVHLLGSVSDEVKRTLLSRASLVLIPGYENYSIVAIEAMAQGVPIVGSNCPGLSDVLGNGSRGALFDYEFPQTAVSAIQNVLEDYDRATAVAGTARGWAWQNCRWSVIAKTMEAIYAGDY